MFPLLTVYETISLNAAMRMHDMHTPQEKEQRVQEVMKELNLIKCAETLIGGLYARVIGISGGEKKRVQFACETLTDPSVIFCDEPTSGLDSFMAATVVTQLKNFATAGGSQRTVIATIHQPSSAVFEIFDELLLLANGRMAYMGKAPDVLQYFNTAGHPAPSNYNPAEFLMELLSVHSEKGEESAEAVNALCDQWEESPEMAAFMKVNGAKHTEKGDGEDAGQDKTQFNSGFCTQFVALLKREMRMKARNPFEYKIPVIQAVILGLIIGLLYFQIDNTARGVQDVNGALFFLVVNQAFTAAFGVGAIFPQELPIVIREYKSRMYGLLPYYLAKQVADLPKQVYQPLLMGSLSFWMLGFSEDISVWGSFCGILILANTVFTSIGYMVTCAFDGPQMVQAFLPLFILPSMLFGGLFINTANIPVYFVWLEHLSLIKYAYHAIMIDVWEDFGLIGCSAQDQMQQLCNFADGKAVLRYQDIQPDLYWPFIFILLGFLVLMRTAGFLFLWMRVSRRSTD